MYMLSVMLLICGILKYLANPLVPEVLDIATFSEQFVETVQMLQTEGSSTFVVCV